MDLDTELAAAFAAMPKARDGNVLDFTDIPALQEYARDVAARNPGPPDPRVTIETLRIPRDDRSSLDVVLFRPSDADGALPVLVWFHGGGQVMGDAYGDNDYHGALASSLGCVVAAVDFRNAPQTPAPGAAEDGYLAYTYLDEHGGEHRMDACRIGRAGASGGGAPAAATALMIRDRRGPRPCLLSLLYPMIDDRLAMPSAFEVTGPTVIDRQGALNAWAAVLGDRVGAAVLDPYCAPARATDLSGLPDTFLAVGQYDVFRDDNIDFAQRLIAAGVPVDLHVYGHAFHAWDRLAPGTALTRTFEQSWHAFLRRHLHG